MLRWNRLAARHPRVAAGRLALLSGLTLVASVALATPAFADDRPDGAEMATAGAMMVVIALAFAIAGLGLLWSWKNGEYEEPEEIKYHMLAITEDDPDFWGMGTHDTEEDDLYEDVTPRKLLGRPAVN
jgi:cbb3-type cytochrome oxidase maturation protein